MPVVAVGDHLIGTGQPCFVVAEAGSNHNGSLEQAKALVRIAAEAGADAVKFQTFRASTMYPHESGSVEYLARLGVTKPIYDVIRDMEMPFEWLPELAASCAEHGVILLSSPFDEECVDAIAPYVPAFKVASYELTHIPLIEHAAKYGKPLIISTGAGNVDEIGEAVSTARGHGAEVVLMQCTAKYPAPIDSLNLRTIPALRERFGVPTGLSDHSRHPLHAPLAAVALGADAIEKHFTISNQLPGPDHSFALEPHELAEMVRGIRAVEAALGRAEKAPEPVEAELANYRRSIYTRRPVDAGEPIGKDDLIVLRRPGVAEEGIRPAQVREIVGARARGALPAGRLLRWDDLELPGTP